MTCDNLFTPSRDNPDIEDLIVLWTRDRTGLRTTGWPRAMANFFDNHGWTATAWFLDNAERLSDERYDGDSLFGKYRCEVMSECFCVYRRAGLDPLDWALVAGATMFRNPDTGEVRDLDGNVIEVIEVVQTGV